MLSHFSRVRLCALGMVLITACCTVLWTSIHRSISKWIHYSFKVKMLILYQILLLGWQLYKKKKKRANFLQLWDTLRHKSAGKDRLYLFTFSRGLSESSCGFKDAYILSLKYLIVACPTFKIRLHLRDTVSHCGLILTVKWEYIIGFGSNTLEEDCI